VQQPETKPFVVEIIQPPAPQTTIKDVFVGAFGLTGLLVLGALVCGAVLAFVFVQWHKKHPAEADHLPPVA